MSLRGKLLIIEHPSTMLTSNLEYAWWKSKRTKKPQRRHGPQDGPNFYWDLSDLCNLAYVGLVSAWVFKTQVFIAEEFLFDSLKCGRFLWWWDFFLLFVFGVWETEDWFELPFPLPVKPCKVQDFSKKDLFPSSDIPCSRLSLITFVYHIPSDGSGCEYRVCYNDPLPDSAPLRQTGSSFNFFNVCGCCFPMCMCICIKFLYSISVLFFLLYNLQHFQN